MEKTKKSNQEIVADIIVALINSSKFPVPANTRLSIEHITQAYETIHQTVRKTEESEF